MTSEVKETCENIIAEFEDVENDMLKITIYRNDISVGFIVDEPTVLHYTKSNPITITEWPIQGNKCPECKTYIFGTSLRGHLNRGDMFTACRKCNILLSSTCSLVIHDQLHKAESPALCPDCGKSFDGQIQKFEKHLLEECFHFFKKPVYQCKLCHIICFNDVSFKEHLFKHIIDVLQCNKCAYFASSLDKMKAHQAVRHPSMCAPRKLCLFCKEMPIKRPKMHSAKHLTNSKQSLVFICSCGFQCSRHSAFVVHAKSCSQRTLPAWWKTVYKNSNEGDVVLLDSQDENQDIQTCENCQSQFPSTTGKTCVSCTVGVSLKVAQEEVVKEWKHIGVQLDNNALLPPDHRVYCKKNEVISSDCQSQFPSTTGVTCVSSTVGASLIVAQEDVVEERKHIGVQLDNNKLLPTDHRVYCKKNEVISSDCQSQFPSTTSKTCVSSTVGASLIVAQEDVVEERKHIGVQLDNNKLLPPDHRVYCKKNEVISSDPIIPEIESETDETPHETDCFEIIETSESGISCSRAADNSLIKPQSSQSRTSSANRTDTLKTNLPDTAKKFHLTFISKLVKLQTPKTEAKISSSKPINEFSRNVNSVNDSNNRNDLENVVRIVPKKECEFRGTLNQKLDVIEGKSGMENPNAIQDKIASKRPVKKRKGFIEELEVTMRKTSKEGPSLNSRKKHLGNLSQSFCSTSNETESIQRCISLDDNTPPSFYMHESGKDGESEEANSQYRSNREALFSVKTSRNVFLIDHNPEDLSTKFSSEQLLTEESAHKLCSVCNVQFADRNAFIDHLPIHHRDDNSLLCLECADEFTAWPSYVRHMLGFHKIRDMDKYILDNGIVAHGMKSAEQIETDSEESTDGGNETHTVCVERFADNRDLQKHFRIHGLPFLKRMRQQKKKSKVGNSTTIL